MSLKKKISQVLKTSAKKPDPFENRLILSGLLKSLDSEKPDLTYISNKVNSLPLGESFLWDCLKFEKEQDQVKAAKLIVAIHSSNKNLLDNTTFFENLRRNIVNLSADSLLHILEAINNSVLIEKKSFHTNDHLLWCLVEVHELYESAMTRMVIKQIILNVLNSDLLSIEWLYEMGNLLYEKVDYEKAILYYSIYLIFNGRSSECFFNRGLCKYNLGFFDVAVADYQAALSLDQANPVIYNNLGDSYYRQSRFTEAIALYDKAISINSSYLKAYYNRGLAFACLQDYEKAVEDFTEVIRLNSEFAEAYHIRGLAYDYLNMADKAIMDYERALKLNPDFDEARNHLEIIKSKLNQVQQSDTLSFDPGRHEMISNHNLSDVIGYDSLKISLYETIILPIKRPDLADKYLLQKSKGILLYGPPGCGKTFVSLALQKETGAKFYYIDNTILNMYVGNTENMIRSVFDDAKKNSPSIIFIDEIDGLIVKRDNSFDTQNWERKIVNQFLIEMSKLETDKQSCVYVIGATNLPWQIDKSFLRAGRLNEKIYIPGPDVTTRTYLFKVYLEDLVNNEKIDYQRLALHTENFSTSIIKSICESIRASLMIKENKGEPVLLSTDMIWHKIESTHPDLSDWLKYYERYRNEQNPFTGSIGFKTNCA